MGDSLGAGNTHNDFENRSSSVRACSSRRSLGVVYLKALFSLES